nr:MAG TPA: hypothetical protein [Bacteriophage sp.]
MCPPAQMIQVPKRRRELARRGSRPPTLTRYGHSN